MTDVAVLHVVTRLCRDDIEDVCHPLLVVNIPLRGIGIIRCLRHDILDRRGYGTMGIKGHGPSHGHDAKE